MYLKGHGYSSWAGYVRTDLLLVAAGIAPNVALAESAGLKTNRGVLVGGNMRTSDPNIYAGGGVVFALDPKFVTGRTWPSRAGRGHES